MNTGDAPTSLAYLILAHKEPDQLRRLIHAIHHSDNYYAIHVDKTAPHRVHQVAAELAGEIDRLYVLPSINCRHGGFSLVRAQQRGIRRLLKAGGDWSHFINLSGEDFPLHPQDTMRNRLGRAKENNFVTVFDPWETDWWSEPDERCDGIYWEPPGEKKARRIRKVKVSRRWILGSARIYGGSQWMILSRSFCEFVANPANVWRYVIFFRNTYVPDETFYQTILMNSPWRDRVIQENLRFIDWGTGPERPRILRADDWGRLRASNALFARKFSPRIDDGILDRLEKALQ